MEEEEEKKLLMEMKNGGKIYRLEGHELGKLRSGPAVYFAGVFDDEEDLTPPTQ